jgi:hypothetical protein
VQTHSPLCEGKYGDSVPIALLYIRSLQNVFQTPLIVAHTEVGNTAVEESHEARLEIVVPIVQVFQSVVILPDRVEEVPLIETEIAQQQPRNIRLARSQPSCSEYFSSSQIVRFVYSMVLTRLRFNLLY